MSEKFSEFKNGIDIKKAIMTELRAQKFNENREDVRYAIHCSQVTVLLETVELILSNLPEQVRANPAMYHLVHKLQLKHEECVSQVCLIVPKVHDRKLFRRAMDKLDEMNEMCERLFAENILAAKQCAPAEVHADMYAGEYWRGKSKRARR